MTRTFVGRVAIVQLIVSNQTVKHNHTAEETQRIKNLHMSGNLGSSDCKTLPIKRSMLLLL